jgi:hypothetical protein
VIGSGLGEVAAAINTVVELGIRRGFGLWDGFSFFLATGFFLAGGRFFAAIFLLVVIRFFLAIFPSCFSGFKLAGVVPPSVVSPFMPWQSEMSTSWIQVELGLSASFISHAQP